MTVCELIAEKFGDKIAKLIEETKRDKRERGFVIYEEDGKLVSGEECVGAECNIRLRPRGEVVGTVHTHPRESVRDMRSGLSFGNFSYSDIFNDLKDEVAFGCVATIDGVLSCINYAEIYASGVKDDIIFNFNKWQYGDTILTRDEGLREMRKLLDEYADYCETKL